MIIEDGDTVGTSEAQINVCRKEKRIPKILEQCHGG